MHNLSIWTLFVILLLCIVVSAFFSASETAMMALNRYKLKTLVDEGQPAAKRVDKLLKKTEQLLGAILLGNNFVNILATSIGTVIGLRLLGDMGVLITTIVLTVLVLLFAEVTPKTLAALFPDKIAFLVSRVLQWCVWVFSPMVWIVNKIVALIMVPLKLDKKAQNDSLSNKELKTLVLTSSLDTDMYERKDMLLSVLELEDVAIDEVMVPRNEVEGIDLNDPWEDIVVRIMQSQHGRIPAYRDNIDNIEGMLHLRDIVALYHRQQLDKNTLIQALRPCTFVPENTPLRKQLLNFRAQHQRTALVVDEYGDIQGMITLEDILANIVGDIDSGDEEATAEVIKRRDGQYDVAGSINVRMLNRQLGLKLPMDGANTLSGLIIETLGNFPEVDTTLQFDDCRITVKGFVDGVIERVWISLSQVAEDGLD